jgi:hypothetical protein
MRLYVLRYDRLGSEECDEMEGLDASTNDVSGGVHASIVDVIAGTHFAVSIMTLGTYGVHELL